MGGLGDLVARAAALATTGRGGPVGPGPGGYSRFPALHAGVLLPCWTSRRRPWPQPLLKAVDVLRSDGKARPTSFLRPNSKWSRRLRAQVDPCLWETAALFHLRDAFRAPATSGRRGRAATAISGGCCWRFPPATRRCGTAAPRRRAELTTPTAMGAVLSTPAGPFVWVNMVSS